MIRLDNVSFSYGINGFYIDGVSLEIEAGEFTAIIGPNGSGKTTLIKIAAGILEGYAGLVEVDGKNIRSIGAANRGRLISYVPQFDAQVFDFTVEEIVMMARRPYVGAAGIPGKRDREAVSEALERCGAASKRTRLYGSLSGGEKRMVLIARAVAQETPVIFMDEPTSCLDIHHQAELMESGTALAREGKAVVMILHSVNLASEFCGRIIALKNGRIQADGAPEAVLTPGNVSEIYGRGLHVARSPVSGKPNIFLKNQRRK